MIDEDFADFEEPIPTSVGFLSGGRGGAMLNYRADGHESGWRAVTLEPGVLYLFDVARFQRDNYSAAGYLVTVRP